MCLKLIDTSRLCARCIDVMDHLYAAFIYSSMKSTVLSNARINVYRTFEHAAAKGNTSAIRLGYRLASWHFLNGGIPRRATLSHDVRVSERLLCSRKILIHLISRETSAARSAFYNATSRMSRNKLSSRLSFALCDSFSRKRHRGISAPN